MQKLSQKYNSLIDFYVVVYAMMRHSAVEYLCAVIPEKDYLNRAIKEIQKRYQ